MQRKKLVWFPEMRKRLCEMLPSYAAASKRSRVSGSDRYFAQAVEKMMAALWRLVPEPERDPDAETQELVRKAHERGEFGRGLEKVVPRLVPQLIHPTLAPCFAELACRQEEDLFAQLPVKPSRKVFHALFRQVKSHWTLREAARFCLRGRPVRLELMVLLGHDREKLEVEVERYRRARQQFRVAGGGNLKEWLDFVDRAGTPEDLAQRPIEGILAHVRGAGAVLRTLVHALCALGCSNLARELSAAKLQQATKLAQRSDWHASLVAEMQDFEACAWRTANPERRLRKLTRCFSSFVLSLERAAGGDLRTFLRDASLEQLQQVLVRVVREHRVQNHRVKSCHNVHSSTPHVTMALRFLKGTLRKHVGCAVESLSLRQLLRALPNGRKPSNPNVRRTLRQEEVARLLEAARDPTERLLLTVLNEVALRSAAVRGLQYRDLVDEDGAPRTECTVLEKGGKPRGFVTSANLRARIQEVAQLLGTRHRETYVFNVRHPHQPLSEKSLLHMLLRLAKEAGITQVRVHPHAFRHTLVERLVSLGNDMELVAKFMGHESVQTTSTFYYVPTPSDIQQRLIDPFSRQERKNTQDSLLELSQAQTQAARRVIGALLQEADVEKVRARVPQLERLLALIDAPLPSSAPATTPPPPPRVCAQDFE